MLEGETAFIRESPCNLMVGHKPLAGLLSCTSYRLRFEPLDRGAMRSLMPQQPLAALTVPLLSIRSVSRGGVTQDCPTPCVDVQSKDFRALRFGFIGDRECAHVHKLIHVLAFPASIDDPQATTGPNALADGANPFNKPASAPSAATASMEGLPSAGWSVYDPEEELRRIGALPDAAAGETAAGDSSAWRLSRINTEYRFSPTYPALLCVPSHFSDREISSIRQFRSRGRIPALTWRHPRNGATLWRSAQPRVGVTNATNAVDERLLRLIRTSTPQGREGRVGLVIADCRPHTNAVANKMAGWGYEGATYEQCALWFLDIENIHRMRESVGKLEALALSRRPDLQWGRAVEATQWLSHVRTVLSGAMRVAQALHRRAAPVLVHCSDGWDRTAQVCGLAQLLLDPYARTIRGFASLVEKEWLSFGHKFQCRLAHGSAKASGDKETSPVFLQFLDCAFQLCSQFPAAFEWGPRLPLFLAHHSTSGRFGTFLFNCERERRAAMLQLRTDSVWDFVLASQGMFLSPFYRPALFGVGGTHPSILPSHPSPVLRQVRLWDDLFLRFSPVPSTSPMQGLAASITGGGAAAARSLLSRADDVISGMAASLPLSELPDAAVLPTSSRDGNSAAKKAASPTKGRSSLGSTALAGSQAGRSAALAAVRALAESGFAVGAEDSLATVLAAVLANAGQVVSNHRVASSADDADDDEPSTSSGAQPSAEAASRGTAAVPSVVSAQPRAAGQAAPSPLSGEGEGTAAGAAAVTDAGAGAGAAAPAQLSPACETGVPADAAEPAEEAEEGLEGDVSAGAAAAFAAEDDLASPTDAAGPSPTDDLDADDAAFDEAVDGSMGSASVSDGLVDDVATLSGAVTAGGAAEAAEVAEAAAEALAATSEAEAAEEVSPAE